MKTTLVAVAILLLSLPIAVHAYSTFAPLDFSKQKLTCKVVEQTHTLMWPADPMFISMKNIELNGKYLPLNIDVDGISVNERFMGIADTPDEIRNETEARTKAYMKILDNTENRFTAWLPNDWDVLAAKIKLSRESDGDYIGTVEFANDNSYLATVDCTLN
ncbi:MAG: hypothetical protein HQK50_05985 [Oligoflexia bacterium]|nr:hypothetical protein [Oligoflexia bacterium]